MKVDELIGELVRLGAASPHGGETVVLLKFEGDVEIEGANLGRASCRVVERQIPGGPHPGADRPPLRSGEEFAGTSRSVRRGVPEGSKDQPDHAEMIRIRTVPRHREEDQAGCRYRRAVRALEHLFRLIETERFGLRRRDSDAGQLWLSQDQTQADFARALAICEATGAMVVHSGSQAVYYRTDDRITIPMRKRFPDPAAYFKTRFHETAHWAEKRVGWKGPMPKAS